MDMEKIIIRCNADYLQYEFPKRKWYDLRQFDRIAQMRLDFADTDALECGIAVEVYENYDGEPIRLIEDGWRRHVQEAMLSRYLRCFKDAGHLILTDKGEDLSQILSLLAGNCNYLSIQTECPQYYEDAARYLEEEYGLVAMFFEKEKELLRFLKQLPSGRNTVLIRGSAEEKTDGGRHKPWDKSTTSLLCGLPKDSFVMDFDDNPICGELILRKRLQITYASIPIFLDNIVKNRYNAVVNEGITIRVIKYNKHVGRRKGNEDGRKEKYPDL